MKDAGKKKSMDEYPPCLWMRAGVVRKKKCRIDFRCPECRFNKVLQRTADENLKRRKKGLSVSKQKARIVYWQDKLRERPQWKRPCRHHMMGRIGFRPCTNEYNCSNCEFHQYFEDQYTVHTVVKPVDMLQVEGFSFPQGYYLHPGHAWVKIEEGSTVRIGFDDFIMRVLGPPDRIQAPLVGKVVKEGKPGITFFRGEHSARVLSPVNGVVMDVNPELRDSGKSTHQHPYSDGWVMRVHSETLRRDIRKLTMGAETTDVMGQDVKRLFGVIEETAGPLAVDGGHLTDDLFGNLPGLDWKLLTRMFLRSE